MNRPQQKPLPSIPSSSAASQRSNNNNPTSSTSSFPRPKAGGGRVLGTAAPKRTVASRARELSPSPSTVSLSSQFSGDNGDLASSSNGTSPSLVCPICNEEMVTLLQLNRHLDDIHREVEELEKDDVKTWFMKRMQKAKQFQPVAVLNQKLKGLEVFEANISTFGAGPSSSSSSARPLSVTPDPDEVVTRAHWQRATNNDYCVDPTCRKPLGVLNGSVNCRKCGKLFCEEHTMYQIKLSRSAQHEPVRGVWCRVCETCYKSRAGYNDHQGLIRDHTKDFAAIRRRTVDRQYLEITRLEKRLTKLTQLLANPPAPEGNSFLRSVSVLRNQRRALEQSVVPWEDDTKVSQCPYCQQTFSQLALRKHHCRLCGKVVCGDQRMGCSTEVGLNVAAMSPSLSEKPLEQVSLDIRICKECKGVVFCKRDFLEELRKRPAVVRQYDTLYQFQVGIKTMMPRFQKLLTALQSSQGPPSPVQLSEAAKIRKKLIDTFAQYDAAAKRIRDLPTDSPAYAHLQKQVHQAASQFLHINMLPLKSLPRILKANKRAPSGLSTMSNSSTLDDNASQADSVASSAYDIEEKQLKEQQMLLEEQKFWVTNMLQDARKKRRFDEIGALQQNVEELEAEIEKVTAAINKLEMGY